MIQSPPTVDEILLPLQDKIRILREQKALSQRDLASLAHINTATINRIETGQHKPQPGTIRKIALALQVPPEELLMDQLKLFR